MSARGRPKKPAVPETAKRRGPAWLRSKGAKVDGDIDLPEDLVIDRDPHLAWIFDESELPDPHGHGERAVKFLRSLKHPKSTARGSAFTLAPWQERIVRRIYGDTDARGQRRVRTVFMLLPRGNRKTALGAGLCLLHTVGPEKRRGGEVIAAAVDRNQARIAYDEAVSIIRADPRLDESMQVRDNRNDVTHKQSRAVFKAIAAEPGPQHGKTPNFILADELHAWKSQEFWTVLRTGVTKTPNSLLIVITTAGAGQENLAYERLEYARKVARGDADDPSFLPILFETAPDADWQDEAVWHAANPGLAYGFPDIAGLRQLASEAAELPHERDAFRQLHLNVWLDSSAAPFVDMQVYDKGNEAVDVDSLRGEPCWLGVDLSSTSDLTAIVAAFRDDRERFLVVPHFFVPANNLRRKAERDGVAYPLWAEQGFITATPGDVIDYRAVEARIRELCDCFDVREIAFDPHMAQAMQSNLLEDGFPVVSFRQGWVTMGPAIKTLEEAIIGRQFIHAGNPVLRWNFANVVVETDKAENKSFHKGKATGRIDGAVAAAMAISRASFGESRRSIYESEERSAGFLII